MKTNISLISLVLLLFFSQRTKAQSNTGKHDFTHKENGWYHVLSTGSLSPKPIITVKDFVGLKLEKDYFGKYAISGQISKHKLNKWADETEKSIGGKIAFVFNDSIITAPQVNCRIESGTFIITSFSDHKLPEIYKSILREKSDSLEVVFNGWEKDSLYYELSPEQRDSVRMSIDYWEAKAWIDLTSNHNEHIPPITYRNGYILDKKGKIIGNYANGHIFDKGRNIKGFYSNGFIYDKNHNIIGNYNNGFVTFKKK